MIRHNSFLYLSFITSVVLMSSCKINDAETIKPLIGKWTLAYSEMNNVQNSFMNNGYMDFGSDSKVSTNIFGGDNAYNYYFDGSQIEISGPENFEMDVQFITSDSIVLVGSIKNFELKFGLSRK